MGGAAAKGAWHTLHMLRGKAVELFCRMGATQRALLLVHLV